MEARVGREDKLLRLCRADWSRSGMTVVAGKLRGQWFMTWREGLNCERGKQEGWTIFKSQSA
jgi:hypothetical protein